MNEYPQVELLDAGTDAVLRFERRLHHPTAKVWRAVTEPTELKAWFPAAVDTVLTPGAAMRFTFPDSAPVGLDGGTGEILELDPPRVFAFRWNSDVLRFELLPDGDGCRLVFTQTLSGRLGRLSAGHTTHGWNECLGALDALLDGRQLTEPTHRLEPTEHYLRLFGLDRGEVHADPDGWRITFVATWCGSRRNRCGRC